jgi:hypothetical protein
LFRRLRQSLKSVTAWVAEAPWLNRERLRVYPKIFLVTYALTFTGMGDRLTRDGKPRG